MASFERIWRLHLYSHHNQTVWSVQSGAGHHETRVGQEYFEIHEICNTNVSIFSVKCVRSGWLVDPVTKFLPSQYGYFDTMLYKKIIQKLSIKISCELDWMYNTRRPKYWTGSRSRSSRTCGAQCILRSHKHRQFTTRGFYNGCQAIHENILGLEQDGCRTIYRLVTTLKHLVREGDPVAPVLETASRIEGSGSTKGSHLRGSGKENWLAHLLDVYLCNCELQTVRA